MKHKIVVITGSTRGIGFGLAMQFLMRKHQVVLNGTTEESVNNALENLKEFAPNVVGITGNIGVSDTHQRLIQEAVNTYGKIDIWINNAGIPQPHRYFWELEEEEIKKVVDINISGMMIGTNAAVNFFNRQGYGKVFNMEGFGSKGRMMDKLTLYGTTKRAVNYFTKSVSEEVKNPEIQVGILSPGMVRTDFLQKSSNDTSDAEQKKNEKVFAILSEDVETVTRFLTKKILVSRKNYDRIEYLTFKRLAPKLIKLMFVK